ncbi:MAG: glutamate 5-kinase [Pirellulales bacterium]
MSDLIRQELATAGTIVVKVGTRVLTQSDGRLDLSQMERLAGQLLAWRRAGRQVVLVSSGAVGAGMDTLGLRERPRDLAKLQAVAAVGQAKLMETYDRILQQHQWPVAQVLLTADDLDHRARYLNVRNTLLHLLELGVLPIINENDTVSVDELMTTFGDNDRLAALVTSLLRAPLLVILSDIEGLYNGPPDEPGSQLVSVVPQIDDKIWGYVRDRKTGWSKGGMAGKLRAAQIAVAAGENVILASGRRPGVLEEILAGLPIGTAFLAQGKSISPWKRWIGFSARSQGKLYVDSGAQRAIVQQGKSLLAVGMARVEGEFEKGDVVVLCAADGQELARGLTNYSSQQAAQICGRRSAEIASILGDGLYEEVVHRDNLVVTSGA